MLMDDLIVLLLFWTLRLKKVNCWNKVIRNSVSGLKNFLLLSPWEGWKGDMHSHPPSPAPFKGLWGLCSVRWGGCRCLNQLTVWGQRLRPQMEAVDSIWSTAQMSWLLLCSVGSSDPNVLPLGTECPDLTLPHAWGGNKCPCPCSSPLLSPYFFHSEIRFEYPQIWTFDLAVTGESTSGKYWHSIPCSK